MAVLKRRSDRIDLLRAIPIFSTFSKKDLNEVAKRADEVAVAQGTVIAKEGERGNQCFVIVKGKVAVKRNDRKITSGRWGAVIGEMSLLDGMPRQRVVGGGRGFRRTGHPPPRLHLPGRNPARVRAKTAHEPIEPSSPDGQSPRRLIAVRRTGRPRLPPIAVYRWRRIRGG